nr:unnamed protein product [Callosobruchus chinensis]
MSKNIQLARCISGEGAKQF